MFSLVDSLFKAGVQNIRAVIIRLASLQDMSHTQTADSKEHLITCLTTHHCPLGAKCATANGLSLIIKVPQPNVKGILPTKYAKH